MHLKAVGNLFDLAISSASLDELQCTPLGEGLLDFETILKKCQDVCSSINISSAGLLELRRDRDDPRGALGECVAHHVVIPKPSQTSW